MSTANRHIAIVTLINPGHVYPMLGLCSELVRRGHRVTYVTDDRLAERVRQTGAEPVLLKTPERDLCSSIGSFPRADDPRYWQLYASIRGPGFVRLAAAIVADVESFYHENVPDLIIYDRFSFAGRILKKRLDSRAINVWSHFAYRESLVRENGVCLNPEPVLAFSHVLDSFMSAHGVEEKGNLWHTEDFGIYLVPREFQYDSDSFDDRFCFVGPCMDRPRRVAWQGKDDGKPIVLITESGVTRDHAFVRTCIDAFAGSQYHVVLSPGANSPYVSNDGLPENFEVNRAAYNTEILPHAVLSICQAGMGIALESLYHGVPIIGVPPTPFHSEVAYRVAELGLGRFLPERCLTADAIRKCADDILQDDALLDRVEAMQKALRRSGGAKLAADRIENVLDVDTSLMGVAAGSLRMDDAADVSRKPGIDSFRTR